MRVPCPAARTTTAATAGPPARVSCGLTDLLDVLDGLCWGTRTRTETARLQRPAGCRLPHPPPAARVGTQVPPAAAPAPEPTARAAGRAASASVRGLAPSRRVPYGGVGYGAVAQLHDGLRPRAGPVPRLLE